MSNPPPLPGLPPQRLNIDRCIRDSEDDHDIKNVDKLEGNSSTNCDFSYFKDKAFFLMFEDYGSHCKNIIVGLDRIVEEFSPGGWGMGTRYSLTLFKTNIADFPSLFETEFRFLIPCFCLLYTSPSPRDLSTSRMPSSA